MFFSARRLVLHQELDELCRQDAAEPGSNFAELWGLKQLLNSVLDELHVKPDSLSLSLSLSGSDLALGFPSCLP